MNRYCSKCGKMIQENGIYCSRCGAPLMQQNVYYSKYKNKKLPTWTIVLICIFGFFCLAALFGDSDTEKKANTDVNISNQNEDNNKKEANIKETKENDKKIIKLGSKEYVNHIKETLLQVQDSSNNLKLNEYRTRGVAYLVATFYTNKYLDDKTMNNEIKNAMKIFYDNFSINEYKSGGFLSSDYEYLNISFYNYKSANSKVYDEYKFIQLDFTNITDYSSFEEFYKKETECISGC